MTRSFTSCTIILMSGTFTLAEGFELKNKKNGSVYVVRQVIKDKALCLEVPKVGEPRIVFLPSSVDKAKFTVIGTKASNEVDDAISQLVNED